MRTALALLLAAALVALASVSDAEGWRCSHSSECPEHELCVASTLTSDTGTCQRIRILP
jgi:hypothetical protein